MRRPVLYGGSGKEGDMKYSPVSPYPAIMKNDHSVRRGGLMKFAFAVVLSLIAAVQIGCSSRDSSNQTMGLDVNAERARFAYIANHDVNTIAIFSIDSLTGQLSTQGSVSAPGVG